MCQKPGQVRPDLCTQPNIRARISMPCVTRPKISICTGGREINASIQTSQGFTELGAETIAPIIAHGVLLDVARYRGVDRIVAGNPIRQDELEFAAQKQGVQVGEGDVVLVRTGNGALWQDPEVYLQAGGVTGSASQWLASKRVRAVGADNMAWDEIGLYDPDFKVTLPGHLILLVRSGIYIIEISSSRNWRGTSVTNVLWFAYRLS